MRNIVQYPVTKEEIVMVLSSIKDSINDEELIGDIRPYIIDIVIDYVNTNTLKLKI